MKRLLLSLLIIAGCFVATTGNAQVYVQAHVSFGPPVPRVFCPPPAPVVVYKQAPVYYETEPTYYDRSCERPVVIRRNDYGYGYDKVRYYENDYRRYDRDDRDRDERGHGRGHGWGHGHGWKNQRDW